MISLDKNQPKYLYKLNVAFVTFFAFWFTAAVAAMVTVGCIYGESPITYATMGGGFGSLIITFVVFWLIDKRLYLRHIEEHAANLEREFCDMPFEEAERILKERGIIKDSGFVADGEIIPFERAHLLFDISLIDGLHLFVRLYDKSDASVKKAVYVFDGAMYNYIAGADMNLNSNETIQLLRRDKVGFTKLVCGYGSIFCGKHY